MENLECVDVNNIRKKWRDSFFALVAANLILVISAIFAPNIVAALFIPMAVFALHAITYLLVYKNYGSFWLVCMLIYLPLFFAGVIVDVIFDRWFAGVVFLPILVWYWINCFRLFKFNRKFKALAIVQSCIGEFSVRDDPTVSSSLPECYGIKENS